MILNHHRFGSIYQVKFFSVEVSWNFLGRHYFPNFPYENDLAEKTMRTKTRQRDKTVLSIMLT